jgi:hypothetical protein
LIIYILERKGKKEALRGRGSENLFLLQEGLQAGLEAGLSALQERLVENLREFT